MRMAPKLSAQSRFFHPHFLACVVLWFHCQQSPHWCSSPTCAHYRMFTVFYEHEQETYMVAKQKHMFALFPCFFVHHSNNDVWMCNHVAMCHVPESIVCAYAYVFFISRDDSGDGVCLSDVNPQHLAMIGSFLLYSNPKWHNCVLYGNQSILGPTYIPV